MEEVREGEKEGKEVGREGSYDNWKAYIQTQMKQQLKMSSRTCLK